MSDGGLRVKLEKTPGHVDLAAVSCLIVAIEQAGMIEMTGFSQVNIRALDKLSVASNVPHKVDPNGLVKIGFKTVAELAAAINAPCRVTEFYGRIGSASPKLNKMIGDLALKATIGDFWITKMLKGTGGKDESEDRSILSLNVVVRCSSSAGMEKVCAEIVRVVFAGAVSDAVGKVSCGARLSAISKAVHGERVYGVE